MNTKRILFWSIFVLVLALIVWGLATAMKNPVSPATGVGTPAPVTAADHTEGPADAKVTLIEYGDFECPACAEFATMVEKLATDEATGTLQIVFRHFPLAQHANAMIAAQASEAAASQGKFWDMYKLIYAGQNDWANLSDADIIRTLFLGYADSLGLDPNKFVKDLTSATSTQIIQAEQAEGQAIGITYTPSFFVNGKLITNPPTYEAFKALIDAAAR
jgi:protein-disulfide isomerase